MGKRAFEEHEVELVRTDTLGQFNSGVFFISRSAAANS